MKDRSAAFRFMRKLRGRSAAELRHRGAQLASVWFERTGLSADAGPSDDRKLWKRLTRETRARIPVGDDAAMLDAFRHSPNRFFAGFDDREKTTNELQLRWPDKAQRIVSAADAVCDGRFTLLGYKGLDNRQLDWHLEPLAAKRAPMLHWSRIDYLDPALVGDHKLIWEINRHQYFVTLGRAYWLTGDERYAREIVRHLESWMDANRPKIGVNWVSSLELAYRSLSWLWALHFLRESESLRPETYVRVLGYLDRKARHIARHLSTYFSPNTHLTGEALGLFALGSCLPQLEHAERWRTTGWRILEEQLPRQVRRDGSYVEQSPHYHRYTVEIYLHALALNRRDRGGSTGIADRLQSALEYAMFLTMPDGLFPLVGDDDGGQLLPLNEDTVNDFRPALSTGAVAFDRGDYATVAGGAAEQTLWLLGPAAVTKFDSITRRPPSAVSRCFPDGGFCVMRDDWTSESNYMLVDAGPHGFLTGGHAHADALSIVLSVRGRPILVDPGTFRYSSTGGERDAFRSGAAHNTATIDGLSSSEPGHGPFQWCCSANATIERWTNGATFDLLKAFHDGFQRLNPPVRHERTVLYVKGRYWVVRDLFIGAGRHRAQLHFHCAPDVQASTEGRQSVRLALAGARGAVDLVTSGGSGQYTLRDDWVSPEYAHKVAATTCVYEAVLQGTTELVTFILPSLAGRLSVRQGEFGEYEVSSDDFRDVHRVGPDGWVWTAADAAGASRRTLVDGVGAESDREPRPDHVLSGAAVGSETG